MTAMVAAILAVVIVVVLVVAYWVWRRNREGMVGSAGGLFTGLEREGTADALIMATQKKEEAIKKIAGDPFYPPFAKRPGPMPKAKPCVSCSCAGRFSPAAKQVDNATRELLSVVTSCDQSCTTNDSCAACDNITDQGQKAMCRDHCKTEGCMGCRCVGQIDAAAQAVLRATRGLLMDTASCEAPCDFHSTYPPTGPPSPSDPLPPAVVRWQHCIRKCTQTGTPFNTCYEGCKGT